MVENIKKLIQKVKAEQDDITLFMLWRDAPELDKWSIVISAPWIDKIGQKAALDYWITLLRKTLSNEELSTVSRVGFLKSNDRFVQSITSALNISGGAATFSQSHVGNYYINEAIIFEAKKEPTVADFQAQITALLSQINDLQAQLSQMNGEDGNKKEKPLKEGESVTELQSQVEVLLKQINDLQVQLSQPEKENSPRK